MVHILRRAKSRASSFFWPKERVLKLIKYLCLVLQSSYKIVITTKAEALVREKQTEQVVIN